MVLLQIFQNLMKHNINFKLVRNGSIDEYEFLF